MLHVNDLLRCRRCLKRNDLGYELFIRGIFVSG